MKYCLDVKQTQDRWKNLYYPKKLVVSATSIWRIIRRDFSLHPYIVQLIEELKASEHKQRHVAAGWT